MRWQTVQARGPATANDMSPLGPPTKKLFRIAVVGARKHTKSRRKSSPANFTQIDTPHASTFAKALAFTVLAESVNL
jgi:hypothetical protein